MSATPKVAVVVPYRASEPHRDAAWAAVAAHYAIHHPEWPLTAADCPGEWAKGAAVNAAVKRTKANVIVIADADSFVAPEVLSEAVEVAPKAGWVVPHITVHRLDEASTARFLAGEPGPFEWVKKPYEGLAGGGIVVVTREAFDAVSGMDERFLHWGSEDIAFGLALETIVGPHHRLFGELWHLWHPYLAHPNIVPPASDLLVHRYHDARLHPGQMRAVIAGESYRKPPLQTQMVRFRTDRDRVTVFCGSERARFRNHVLDTRDPDLIEALRMVPTVEEVSL